MKKDESTQKKETILEVTNLKKYFHVPSSKLFAKDRILKAVDNVTFKVYKGETLGIVGESGCGKSTLGRSILKILEPTDGSLKWHGTEISGYNPSQMRPLRKDMQFIFQDPFASLNPRMTVGNIISEPLKVFNPDLDKEEVKQRVQYWLKHVGLLPEMINRYPHEFSGGQCQRIGIARAMINNPQVIVCDEPVSALDVSIQAQVVNLLQDLQKEFHNSMMFISHDLSVVRHISDRIMVLYLGNVLEIADKISIYKLPLHPYTKGLISAVPIPDPIKEKNRKRLKIYGEIPSPLNPPSGCVFRTRCPFAKEKCAKEVPLPENYTENHVVSCHYWKEINDIK